MSDKDCSKEDLINELNQLRKRNMELEVCLREKSAVNLSSPLYDSEGAITHAVVKPEDISEYKRIEQEQKRLLAEMDEQRGLLQSIIESVPVGLWVTDANGKMILINDNARQIWGGMAPYADSVLGYEVYNARWADTGEKILSEDMPMARALRGDTIKEVAVDFERFDGTHGTQFVSAAPIRDSKGNITGSIAIVQDITEHKMAERALHQSEERFRALVTASSDVVYRMSPDWREMRQLQGKDFIPDTDDPSCTWIDKYIHPDDQQRVVEVINEAIRTKGIFELEHRVLRVDGTLGWTLSRAVPMLDADGQITEWFGTASDITVQKRAMELYMANKALEKTIEMKDEFLSLISHEFRTPLNVINTAIQALNSIYAEEMTDKVKEYMGTIRQNTFRQLRLVNNLLDITRANAGHIKINKKNIDIVFLTKCITESVYQYASQKGVRITFVSSCVKKIIGIDDEKYERILLNLLSNAIKFSPEGKSIIVTLRSVKGNVCVEVKDTGIGIPPNKIDLIFERFGQVDSLLSRRTEGTGIGLSLVKKFVEALGGSISIKSKVGKGSTFTLLLPDKKAAEEHDRDSRADMMDNRLVQTINVEFSDIYL